MDATPTTSTMIAQHQGKSELLFCGGVMLDPQYARKHCAWLEPGLFLDDRLGRYWGQVKDGKDPHQAAMELGLYFEIAGQMTQIVSTYDTPFLAESISADRYLMESGSYLSDMAKAIANRDVQAVRSLAQCIASASPYTGEGLPSALQLHREFEQMLDNIGSRVILTGISTFDHATGGLEKQTLNIIGARPSMGKTSFGCQIAQTAARAKVKTIVFEAEMSSLSLWARMACGKLRISWRDVLAKRITPAQVEAIKKASKALADEFGEYLIIDDKAAMTNDDIYRKVSNIGPELIIVDHLDLINRGERGKVQEVIRLGNVSRYGKIIAKEFDIPAVYLMQLNRDTEKRDNKRPTLADIRGSGEIEQDADNIFFLYRPDYYDDATKDPPKVSKTEVIVGKFRNGIRNIQIDLMYHLDEQWFYPPTGERRG